MEFWILLGLAAVVAVALTLLITSITNVKSADLEPLKDPKECVPTDSTNSLTDYASSTISSTDHGPKMFFPTEEEMAQYSYYIDTESREGSIKSEISVPDLAEVLSSDSPTWYERLRKQLGLGTPNDRVK